MHLLCMNTGSTKRFHKEQGCLILLVQVILLKRTSSWPYFLPKEKRKKRIIFITPMIKIEYV